MTRRQRTAIRAAVKASLPEPKTPKGWDEAVQDMDDAAKARSARPDVGRLDAMHALLKNDGKAKRAKGTTFSLQCGPTEGTLQGPRGKTVATFKGTPDEQKQQARAHAARMGKDLTIYD